MRSPSRTGTAIRESYDGKWPDVPLTAGAPGWSEASVAPATQSRGSTRSVATSTTTRPDGSRAVSSGVAWESPPVAASTCW